MEYLSFLLYDIGPPLCWFLCRDGYAMEDSKVGDPFVLFTEVCDITKANRSQIMLKIENLNLIKMVPHYPIIYDITSSAQKPPNVGDPVTTELI